MFAAASLLARYAIDLTETRYATTRQFLASGRVVELNDAHNRGTFFAIDGKLYAFPLAFVRSEAASSPEQKKRQF